jgi:Tat protein secretion system quality control protein TatD with DNase activity
LFFFGFSHAVNYAMCTSDKSRRKGRDAVKAVPIDRIVVESDVHHLQDVLGGTIGAILYVAWSKQVSAVEIAERSARNGLKFLGQRSDPKTLS